MGGVTAMWWCLQMMASVTDACLPPSFRHFVLQGDRVEGVEFNDTWALLPEAASALLALGACAF